MDGKTPSASQGEVLKAVINYAREVAGLSNSIRHVAVTAASLAEVLDQADGVPSAGGSRHNRVDAVTGELIVAYQRIVHLLDDL